MVLPKSHIPKPSLTRTLSVFNPTIFSGLELDVPPSLEAKASPLESTIASEECLISGDELTTSICHGIFEVASILIFKVGAEGAVHAIGRFVKRRGLLSCFAQRHV
ncbi:unnamed protein product [Dovyalis caffra]|uniref:Uncharacterized protein n=1 Tax=Dovyalis caffra TaxID=77055 RepID=A0AAV1QZV7_9ROSI|nr:unnamed protein product [Dovyalis caffra]